MEISSPLVAEDVTVLSDIVTFIDTIMFVDTICLNQDTTFCVGSVAIDMVFVQGGTFMMGCTEEQEGVCFREKAPHQVTANDFYIGKYEVTQMLWIHIMGYNPSHFEGDDLPVESISWDDVQEFIQKLNSMTGKEYRLPTEVEWEYAARGGSKSKKYKYAGSNKIDDVAWYDNNSDRKTHPVCTKQPNELCIYDMSGNVWEWVSDSDTSGVLARARRSPSGPNRVVRGASWHDFNIACRVSNRANFYPDKGGSVLGFRLALSP
jgi:formylglycine-generating enzyme required for sulfatase activity